MTTSRRQFLQAASALASVIHVPWSSGADERPKGPNDRLRIGSIGMRYQGSVIAEKATGFGDIVALCDVDRQVAEKARTQFGGQATLYEDYHDLLARPDIDVVTIGTPEGRRIIDVVQATRRIVQVGTWQRSDSRFRLACELVRSGRIGPLKQVTVVLGKNVAGGPFSVQPVPAHLNWNQWQGPTADVPYIPERCHYTFRWWHEYSGGQMTDWGAHHVDIAHWGMGMETSGPVRIESSARFPAVKDGYNVPLDFEARLTYANGVVLEIKDSDRNGVLFEGTEGRLFVNRGTVSGKPVEDLVQSPLRREDFQLYGFDNLSRPERAGKLDAIINHMGNFYDCVVSRRQPLADVTSQHRSVSACHLANISMRLGRTLDWNPDQEQFVNDPDANRWLARDRRKGFELG
jgi:predicted dehydrogenase